MFYFVLLLVYWVRICTFIVPQPERAVFLSNFVPRLVYKVYKTKHFNTLWNTLIQKKAK